MRPASATGSRGTRCRACGRVTAVVAAACPCCASPKVTVAALASTGRVEAWTRVGETVVVQARLAGGPLVLGRLAGGTTEVDADVVIDSEADGVVVFRGT